ncbi:hypothetical protein CSOJ01_03725 [Colletotrichum sojae]|uniref:Ubiquitin-like domain-containing protein n=1 Tax=Colletotrichum sojae TaxID=2175907 RepID=A0A8H6N0I1_9PEZI|nr:hypothetical protein CSOJ01_03725 [Colletotrichum sojae]
MADAKPKRKLPFKLTALRSKTNPKPSPKSDDEDDGLDLFQRSKEFWPRSEQEAEERRRNKRKQAERENSSQADPPNPKRSPSRVSEDPVGRDSHEDAWYHDNTPPSKRSRTSDDSPNSKAKSSPSKQRGDETPSKRMTRAAASRTPRKQEPLPPKPIISIDDSDDDQDDDEGGGDDDDIYDASPIRNVRRQTSESSSCLVVDDDDDDVFAENNPPGLDDEEDDEMEQYLLQAKERQKAREEEQAGTQILDVAVTTNIPGASSKQFRFTLSKQLKVLRTAWIQVQQGRVDLPQAELEKVFLTWRGHRLYDFTTLNSLDLPGEFRKATGGREGSNDEWTQVHMEMWTPDLWEEHQKQVDRQRRHDLGEYSEDEGGAGEDDAAEAEPEEQKIKVLLKTKTAEPLKTSVRPSTTIGTIMELFRKMRGLAPDAPITLMFDGDELEESMTVEEADVGDMETIEVYIR